MKEKVTPFRKRGDYKHGYLPEEYPNSKNGFLKSWINSKPTERYKTKDGYIEIDIREDFDWMSNNPHKVRRMRYREHQYIMEKQLGRYLKPEETVHHKNLIRDDNRIENLELWTDKHPTGARVEDILDYVAETYPVELKERLYLK
jgi:hypothetical protein